MNNNDIKNNKNEKPTFMLKLAGFIVDKRNLFFLIFAIAVIFSLISSGWVKVENELAAYLPSTFETNKGLTLMDEEFKTYGSAEVMVINISYEEAMSLKETLETQNYVAMVQFDNSKEHYNDFSALFSITFEYYSNDSKCKDALGELKEALEDYEYYISSEIGNSSSETIAAEMQVISVLVAIVVVTVLLLTTSSYAEVPVLLITFLVSAALAKGTNYIFGTISYVSDSVAIVLQLALSVDYAVILCNRYKNEHQTMDPRSACVLALSKAIPEISASSLTTIGGLVAMCFMQFGIGPDMAIVLIKAIILSLLSVFLLMPGIIMLFSNWMDKTTHKNFIPKIPFVGKFAYATRKVIPFIFIGILAVAFCLQRKCPYVYGYSLMSTPKQSEQQKVDKLISDTFGDANMIAIVVPGHDYEKEEEFLTRISKCPEVDSTMGLANTEAMNGYMLTEKLNARQFSEMLDIDKSIAEILYSAYAINDENYAKIITGISDYRVTFLDMFDFLYDELQEGYVTLDDEMIHTVEEAHSAIKIAREQLQGENYDRMLVYLNLPQEGDETRAFLDDVHTMVYDIYGKDADILVIGDSTSQYDLYKTFERDNAVVNAISILAVLVVLLFTFKSAGMPVLLILVIQGCIWMNFSFPAITKSPVFFIGYLIVSSIQMGANIDYAIVVSSRYQEIKHDMSKREAIIDSMNFAFPTIVTSGTMLAMAGILIGRLTSDACICCIGQCIGRGTIISIFTVLFVLPQILLLGDKIIDRTSFDVNVSLPIQPREHSGYVRIDGLVRGNINGVFIGTVHGIVKGDVNLNVVSGNMVDADNINAYEQTYLDGMNAEENIDIYGGEE